MSKGDIRKCAFCLKEYIARENDMTEVCQVCYKRHTRSKKGEVLADKKISVKKDYKARRGGHKNSFAKPLPDLKVSLNWKSSE